MQERDPDCPQSTAPELLQLSARFAVNPADEEALNAYWWRVLTMPRWAFLLSPRTNQPMMTEGQAGAVLMAFTSADAALAGWTAVGYSRSTPVPVAWTPMESILDMADELAADGIELIGLDVGGNAAWFGLRHLREQHAYVHTHESPPPPAAGR